MMNLRIPGPVANYELKKNDFVRSLYLQPEKYCDMSCQRSTAAPPQDRFFPPASERRPSQRRARPSLWSKGPDGRAPPWVAGGDTAGPCKSV